MTGVMSGTTVTHEVVLLLRHAADEHDRAGRHHLARSLRRRARLLDEDPARRG